MPTAETPLQSVLDRLLDDSPGVSTDVELFPADALRRAHDSVRRDLNTLLNTRQRVAAYPAAMKRELDQSLVNYGLPDFTGGQLGSATSRENFLHVVEKVLERYEPRLKSVRVTMLGNAEPLDRTLRFRIDAVLQLGTVAEPVTFDSKLEPTTGIVEVTPSDA